MSSNEFYADTGLSFSVKREDDESGAIVITIKTNDDVITINAGRFQDDASSLETELRSAVAAINKIVRDWEDRPDNEGDAFVSETRDGYTAQIEGVPVKCAYNRWDAFPSHKIATYELARDMAESGVSPAAWFVNERGNCDAINDAVNELMGDDGKMLPLPGVRYEEGQEVSVHAGRWTVVRDYGSDLGVVASFYGEETRVFEHDELTPYDDEEDDDEDQD